MNMMDQATAMPWGAPVSLESDVSRLRRGDPEALTALLERYQHLLYRYLLRLVREPATAEDLFQQTWLRVAGKIRRYDPRRSFEAWLFSVARNLAIDHLRRYRPESLDEALPSGQPKGEQIAAAGPSAMDLVLARERASGMVQALAELPAIYREVLALRFEEEMKLEEIAGVLDVPLATVKTRLGRALENLRRRMEAGEQGDGS
jgi:RNA polymerase sigma-70 factor (ECF subfamily)